MYTFTISRLFRFFSFILLAFFLVGCGGGSSYKKSPLDEIIRDLPDNEVYSVILYDMDVKGNFFESYFHKYKIVRGSEPDKVSEIETDWKEVSEKEFKNYVNDMGMEIAARDSTGKLTKNVAPPGYNNYVGNPRYGYWNNSGGSSFWAFYGQYAFMSSMFNMMTYPARRSYYDDWRGNYYGSSRRYYGPRDERGGSGGRYYGTNSSYNRNSNPSSSWSRNNSSFKNRVAGRTGRTSSNRSSSGSSRSRGGGFGK